MGNKQGGNASDEPIKGNLANALAGHFSEVNSKLKGAKKEELPDATPVSGSK